MSQLSQARAAVTAARRPAVLTGAGMSAESGVPTFRDALTGLWERFDPAALASPQGWASDPALVWGWYRWRAAAVRRAEPNPGHLAVAAWGRRVPLQLITQNVDDLHERAGSEVLTHLHGSLFDYRCARCGEPVQVPDPDPSILAGDGEPEQPPRHDCGGLVRPAVVWFGELLPEGAMESASAAVDAADLLLVIGTSGVVYPAAGLADLAHACGVPVIEVNPDPTGRGLALRGTAAELLPALLA